MRQKPKNDLEFSRQRLDTILGRRRLLFNPYKVSDRQLLDYAWQGNWGTSDDLTQMVIMRFTRMAPSTGRWEYDGIYVKVGRREEEVFIARGRLMYPVTAYDTTQVTRNIYGSRKIYNERDIQHLVGKTVFVSRVVRGYRTDGSGAVAYRMHPLRGNLASDATMIRKVMCEAKIEMLQRVLNNPEPMFYLSCSKGFFDYEPRIQAVIERSRPTPNPPSLPIDGSCKRLF